MEPRVRKVTADKNFKLIVTFTNDEIRQFDVTPYLEKGIFKRLKDWEYFKQVHAALGTVVWPGELDIAPETIYLDSIPLK